MRESNSTPGRVRPAGSPRYFLGEVFVSEVLSKPALDAAGDEIGRVQDFIVSPGEIFPKVAFVVVKGPREPVVIPWEQVAFFNKKFLSLNILGREIKLDAVKENDILIARDILDKQIVDVNGAKIVRVNDLKLGEVKGHFCLIAADVGIRGLIRRLLGRRIKDQLGRFIHHRLPHHLIGWNYLEHLKPKITRLTLSVPRGLLNRMHPADLASVIQQMPARDRIVFYESLDLKAAAEVLHELEPAVQVEIVSRMDPEHAVDILERMPPDEATDVLGDLPPPKAQKLMALMNREDAKEVQDLLAHTEDTAGGLMTTEFLTFSPDLTAGETIEIIRKQSADVETIYYVYMADPNGRPIGVLSLRELIMATPEARLSEIMTTRLKTVTPETHQTEVAKTMSKYNLVAIPVVDRDRKMLGVVTIDDIVDLLVPPVSKKKPRRLK
ncbi:MAG: magnesium transporter [Nitrospirae bacterium]|nr:magnesium transporter [Nitrospirota bacterium]